MTTVLELIARDVAKLSPEQRDLFAFAQGLRGDVLHIYFGFAVANAIHGEADFWKTLANFRQQLGSMRVVTSGGTA